jgi:cell division protein FtsI (penicillin-binding protein 3)
MSMARPNPPRRDRNGTASRPRSGQFSASPVLGLRLPMWRSKLVVFMMFAAFGALAISAMRRTRLRRSIMSASSPPRA